MTLATRFKRLASVGLGVCLSLLLASCGGNTSDTLNASLTATPTAGSAAGSPLLASLALSYPSGQLPQERAAEAAAFLAQNPAALKFSATNATNFVASFTAKPSAISPQAATTFAPVRRAQNTSLFGSYFFSIYTEEMSNALATNPKWNLEGTAFYASLAVNTGLDPVWRFRNLLNGSYLYTINEGEKNDIIANYSTYFTLEGPAWFASPVPAAGYTPLYRFRNLTNGTYLFSAYESEKDAIVAGYQGIFLLEGISYYVSSSVPASAVTGEVKPELIVVPPAALTANGNSVAPMVGGGVQLNSSDPAIANVVTGSVVHIPATAGGLSLPFTGKVVNVSSANGQKTVQIVPANVEDVFNKLSWDINTAKTGAQISGIIAPAGAKATFSQTQGKAVGLNAQQQQFGFKSQALTATDTTVNGNIEISRDFVVQGKTITLVATIDVSDLSLRSKGEYDPAKFLTGGGWANVTAVITGKTGGSIKLKGETPPKMSIGELLKNSNVWDELKWRGGENFTLEGLDSKDKTGRFPLGGVILVPGAVTAFKGNMPDSAITLLSAAPSAVLWLYIDMSGNITASGEAGWRAVDYQFERGYELAAKGLELEATKINNLIPGRQELFGSGKVELTQRAGISIAADVLIGGIRPANVNAFIGGEYSKSFEGEGVLEITPTQKLSGILCTKDKIWAGAELNAAFRVKAKVKADLYFANLEAQGTVQKEYSEKTNTWIDQDLGSQCVSAGLFSITAATQGPDAANVANSLVNVDFTPAYNNNLVKTKTDHWLIKASCTGCADLNFEIPDAKAGLDKISLPNGKNYTLTLSATNNTYGLVKSATTTVATSSAPVASFAVKANSGLCTSLSLTATASAMGGQTISSYAWTVQRAGSAQQFYTGNPVNAVTLPSCGDTSVLLKVTDTLGYTTSVTQTVNTTQLGATITSVSPPDAVVNTAKVFTVVGTNLPLTAIMAIQDASCTAPVNNTANGFQQTCTPLGTAGTKTVTIKTASGGSVIDATRSVNVTAASTQYSAVTGGCVKDAVTGLTWEVKTNDGLLRDWNKTYTNYDASYGTTAQINAPTNSVGFANDVNATNLCGYSDWRLPTKDELMSLVKTGVGSPTIDTAWFPNTRSYVFWASSPIVNVPQGAWNVDFNNGSAYDYDSFRGNIGSVRLVRSDKYTAVTGGCVRDNTTGLTWEVKTNDGGLRDMNKTYTNFDANYGTTDLINASSNSVGFVNDVNATNLCGYSNWRMPTKDELISLVKMDGGSPTIDMTWFPNTLSNPFWSSSPYVGIAQYAWGVSFLDRYVSFGYRTNPGSIRLVR